MNALADYKTELEKRGEIIFIPSGNSMWPTLKDRAQSVVVKSKAGRISVGEVALFYKQGVIALHRVMRVLDNGYITCGDSQFKHETVLEDEVLGVMTGFYKGKTFIPVTDKKHAKKVERWYKHKTWRKFRIKLFYFSLRVKNFLSKKKVKEGK